MVFALARYLPTGELDASGGPLPGFGTDGRVTTDFGTDTTAQIEALYTNGRELFAAGAAATRTEPSVYAVAHYFPDGSLDPAFDGDGNGDSRTVIPWGQGAARATAVESQPRIDGVTDGGLVVAGTVDGDDPGFGLVRLVTGGALDSTFGATGRSYHDSPIWDLPSAGGLHVEPSTGGLWLAGSAVIKGELDLVTTIPILKFDLSWDPDYDDALQLLELCDRFNERVYDVTDGQMSVQEFSLRGEHVTKKEQAPFVESIIGEAQGEMSRTAGEVDPQEPLDLDALGADPWPGGLIHPEIFEVVVPDAPHPSDATVGRMVASWLTGHLGHGPESTPFVKGGILVPFPGCPLPVGFTESDACIMSSPFATELCRATNHSPDTAHGAVRGVSCYEWLANALSEPGFVVPSLEIEGPSDPPPHWTLVRGRDVVSAAMDHDIHVVKEDETLQPYDARRGLVLTLPNGKRLELAFSMYAKHHDYSGYANGKVVAKVSDGAIDSLVIRFQHRWHGVDVSNFTGGNMWGWGTHPGDYGAATHALTKKTKYILAVDATANAVSEIHWQFHHAVRFGDWDAHVDANTTNVVIEVADEGHIYKTVLEGAYSLSWDGSDW